MQLSDDGLVGNDARCGQFVGERQRVTCTDDLASLLVADLRRALAGEQCLDLDVGGGVALDPCRAVDRPHPGAATHPLRVGGVDRQVVEQPAPLIEVGEGLGESASAQPITHGSLR